MPQSPLAKVILGGISMVQGWVSRLAISIYLTGASLAAWAGPTVKIGSDDWCPFICGANNRIVGGLLVEMTDLLLGASGNHVEPLLLPLNRAMLMAEQGALDGIYAPAIDDRLLMTQPLLESRTCFYTLKDTHWDYKDIASLSNTVVGVIDDYGYDNGEFDAYLGTQRQGGAKWLSLQTGGNAGEHNVSMLLEKRFAVMAEHEAVMTYLLKTGGPQAQKNVRNAGCLKTRLPLVIGFGKNNPQAAAWIRQINLELAKPQTRRALAKMQKKYGL